MARKTNSRKPLGLINQPYESIKEKQSYKRIACVFQGGGALGAYQVGAYRAIHEHGYTPNYLAGVSIGAINSSIIAGNPRELQVEKLMEFWNTIVPSLWTDQFHPFKEIDCFRHMQNRLGSLYSVFFGLEGFFKPRPIPPSEFTRDTPDNLSYYDTSELRHTLQKVIDFDRINAKEITLCLGAVNVASGEMTFFNNQRMKITPDHIMASCSLPPGFPAIEIDGEFYWDGGIYANTPLVTVLDALPEEDTLCFVVDCFSLKGPVPETMDQVEERQKDIRYASHSRRMTNVYSSRQNLQSAITLLSEYLPPHMKKDPAVQNLLQLGIRKRFSVVHIIYHGTPYAHSYKDYNFARSAINVRLETGYKNAIEVLNNPEWETQSTNPLACSIYGVPPDYFYQR
jgi:NTE family protein